MSGPDVREEWTVIGVDSAGASFVDYVFASGPAAARAIVEGKRPGATVIGAVRGHVVIE